MNTRNDTRSNATLPAGSPSVGQPFNFSHVLDCVLIPRTIACDRALLPGARLLWGALRQRSYRDGRCTCSDQQLGDEVAVNAWAIRKYLRQLRKAGLVQVTPRAGKTPVRELLWHPRFAGLVQRLPARPEVWSSSPAQARQTQSARVKPHRGLRSARDLLHS